MTAGVEEFYGAPNEENMAKCNFLWMWQHQMLLPVSRQNYNKQHHQLFGTHNAKKPEI